MDPGIRTSIALASSEDCGYNSSRIGIQIEAAPSLPLCSGLVLSPVPDFPRFVGAQRAGFEVFSYAFGLTHSRCEDVFEYIGRFFDPTHLNELNHERRRREFLRREFL